MGGEHYRHDDYRSRPLASTPARSHKAHAAAALPGRSAQDRDPRGRRCIRQGARSACQNIEAFPPASSMTLTVVAGLAAQCVPRGSAEPRPSLKPRSSSSCLRHRPAVGEHRPQQNQPLHASIPSPRIALRALCKRLRCRHRGRCSRVGGRNRCQRDGHRCRNDGRCSSRRRGCCRRRRRRRR